MGPPPSIVPPKASIAAESEDNLSQLPWSPPPSSLHRQRSDSGVWLSPPISPLYTAAGSGNGVPCSPGSGFFVFPEESVVPIAASTPRRNQNARDLSLPPPPGFGAVHPLSPPADSAAAAFFVGNEDSSFSHVDAIVSGLRDLTVDNDGTKGPHVCGLGPCPPGCEPSRVMLDSWILNASWDAEWDGIQQEITVSTAQKSHTAPRKTPRKKIFRLVTLPKNSS